MANRLNCDVVLCDDGLQHYALGRQLEIGVIDASRKFGNKLPLPAGPLREPVSRIGKCQYVIINSGVVLSCPEGQFDIKGVDNKNIYTMVLQSSVLVNIRTGEIKNISQFSGAIVHAVAGIGNPDRFFSSLRQLGLQVIEHPRPDHHVLQEQELDFGDSHLIIMTEKDAVKLCQPVATNLWYLPVTAHLPDSFVKKFLADVKSFIK